MKQNADDSQTSFDTQPAHDTDSAAPTHDWRLRAARSGNKLRELPQGTIVGLSAVGGALAVLLLSAGTQLVTPLPQIGKAKAPTVTAKNKPVPVANTKVYIAPEDQMAALPDVHPGVSATAFETRNSNHTGGEILSPEIAAETGLVELRRREDQVAVERQRLEDRKRIIERELENKEIENKRLQEDKALEEQRRAERRRLREERQMEDKRLAAEAEQNAQRRIDEERQLEEERKREEEKLAAAP
ncbi:MAG TPA: hypothetical protein VF600_14005 [Abditibacteriaceae bacterium]|jgi:hypothetical protein